jgi:hypothetical protein
VFDPDQMAHDHSGPDSARLIVARISGVALRHASWREPTEPEIAAAVAELREVAGDRPDLLAEEAGILLGFHEGGLDEPRAKAAARLLIAAGADESLIRSGSRRVGAGPSSGGIRHSADRVGHHGARERLPHMSGMPAISLREATARA